MTTPIAAFLDDYVRLGFARLHMPGHKGALGGDSAYDITEVTGADSLYEAGGVIAESEENAASLFHTRRTVYSTEGSSQGIRAMLYLALTSQGRSGRPVALAGRNAHKAFLYAAALCDFDIAWLYPERESASPCACPITAAGLERALEGLREKPFCVYVTSPDYLGGVLDIAALKRACVKYDVPLLVDGAHGAYLAFLRPSEHPIALGADMCCDSAHKTLPALTGAAYLHIAQSEDYAKRAKQAMALFGSTSPSYLILRSLDLCNAFLAGDFPERLYETAERLDAVKAELRKRGFDVLAGERLKLTLRTDGPRAMEALRRAGVEAEYADAGHVVLMASPYNAPDDFRRVLDGLIAPFPYDEAPFEPPVCPRAMSVREALFAPSALIDAARAVGRVCAAPTVTCPPAVPIVVSGEVITAEAAQALERFGVRQVAVVA